MTIEKRIEWRRLALVSVLGASLLSCRRNAELETQQVSTVSRPHGELISASSVAPTTNAVETNHHGAEEKASEAAFGATTHGASGVDSFR